MTGLSTHRRWSRFLVPLAACLLQTAAATAQGRFTEPLHALHPDDGAAGAAFGYSVAVDNGIVLVGAPEAESPGSSTGGAYLFDATTGQQTFKLTIDDLPSDARLGHSVAIADGLALVSAPGAASVYIFDTHTGQSLGSLNSTDGVPGDHFGRAVAASGNIAIVSAPNHEHSDYPTGAAYLFDLTSGDQMAKLTVETFDGMTDGYGNAVAISGDTALVGAPHDEHAGGTIAGAAYAFDVNTGEQRHKLIGHDTGDRHVFGYSLAIHDDIAAVGAVGVAGTFDDAPLGRAYLFDVSTGQELASFHPDGPVFHSTLGWAVAVQDNLLFVAEPSAAVVDVFDVNTGERRTSIAGLHHSLAVDPDHLVTASPGNVLVYIVPEPHSLILLAVPAAVVAMRRKRNRRR